MDEIERLGLVCKFGKSHLGKYLPISFTARARSNQMGDAPPVDVFGRVLFFILVRTFEDILDIFQGMTYKKFRTCSRL